MKPEEAEEIQKQIHDLSRKVEALGGSMTYTNRLPIGDKISAGYGVVGVESENVYMMGLVIFQLYFKTQIQMIHQQQLEPKIVKPPFGFKPPKQGGTA